jgi:hypothetical protein
MPQPGLFRKRGPAYTLERILSDPEFFGLTTISPLQRAICRVLDGLPVGHLAPEVAAAFGGPDAVAMLPRERPHEVVILAGIRCGKSLLSAACAVRAALTCDVSSLSVGDVPSVPILSYDKTTAKQTWLHIRNHIQASPTLSAMLIGEPTAEALTLRHPSGRPIEIRITAGSRAAGSLVARWLAGAIFDEAPRMLGVEDGVVNLDEARQAIAGRLLPGAQVIMPGSPWAPFGPVYKMVEEHFGKPSRTRVVVRAPNFVMNPRWWTP